MTGAMYAAVSGLKTHMQKLNVIGNNVANVNTFGYKAARATFKESLYTTLRGGSNGSATSGGMNPSQIGYGCSMGSIDLDMSTKSYMPTGIGTDCMIDGGGFLLVGAKPATVGGGVLAETDAKNLYLTRVGDLSFDRQGYLTDSNGQVVYGFVTSSGATTPGVKSDPLVTSTQLVPIRLPLRAGVDNAAGVLPGTAIYPGINDDGMNVYDTGAAGGAGGGTAGLTDGSTTITVDTTSISIDGKTGKIIATNDVDNSEIVVGYIPLGKVSNPEGVSHVQGPYYRAGEGAGDCWPASIGGVLDGKFLNNAAADDDDRVPINSAGGTELVTGGLESSGTDVAQEFTEMITTQRGYQANTRIITVTDAMLEELVNIKR